MFQWVLGIAIAMLCSVCSAYAQAIKSPDEFLGYKLGSRFTPHYRVLAYFEYVSKAAKSVKLQPYGETYEHRALEVAIVTSAENFSKLEDLRRNNLKLAGIEEGTPTRNQPIIVWLSYNVHGNEAVSSEAAMKVLYELVNPSNLKTKNWLQNTVVIIDPCLNPDGHERYLNFYTETVGRQPNLNLVTREHQEPWPSGRSNHYMFDLNRDWAWQTQQETQQRMALYNQWLPQIHVDFHEMGINDPYFFAPAASPYHEALTPWQREFQVSIGKNNARYFDQNNWLFFTKEVFDLFYPSYGDTYPMFNGAIGMTYEQGGSGRAGLKVITRDADSLTLEERINHHYTTSLSTIEVASTNAVKAVNEFKDYFTSSKTNPKGPYKAYVVKGNAAKLHDFANLLQRNGIQFGYGAAARSASGFSYFTGRVEPFSINKYDLVISAYQPKSVFLNVLFEPRPRLADSITYDLTSWALPYTWGLESYACESALKPLTASPETQPVSMPSVQPVAYVCEWKSLAAVKFLAELLQKKVNVRFAESSFSINKKTFEPGTLIIPRAGNKGSGDQFDNIVNSAANTNKVSLDLALTSFVDQGADFGSSSVHLIKAPKIAVLMGEDVSENAFGEVWHFFDQQLNYPADIIQSSFYEQLKLYDYDVIILPSGNYSFLSSDKELSRIRDWVKEGGRVIALGNTLLQLAGKTGFSLKQKNDITEIVQSENSQQQQNYSSRSRNDLADNSMGSIYKLKLDNTHPLGFGFGNFYFSLRQDVNTYQLLPKGNWNVGVIEDNGLVSGFVGYKARAKLKNTLIFGVEEVGQGQLIYMADNPLFRSFWENGKLLFSNAVFFVGQK